MFQNLSVPGFGCNQTSYDVGGREIVADQVFFFPVKTKHYIY